MQGKVDKCPRLTASAYIVCSLARMALYYSRLLFPLRVEPQAQVELHALNSVA